VPADPSSSIPAALAQLADTDPLGPGERSNLLADLAQVPDPRRRQGSRFELVVILALAAAAVLTGARSLTAIAQWAADTQQPIRAALGARQASPQRWVVPSESTIRRTLGRLDPAQFAQLIAAWLTDRRPDQRPGPAPTSDRRGRQDPAPAT